MVWGAGAGGGGGGLAKDRNQWKGCRHAKYGLGGC